MIDLRAVAAIALLAGTSGLGGCGHGARGGTEAAVADAEALLREAAADRDPLTRERRVRDAVERLEGAAPRSRRARLLLLHALPLVAADPGQGSTVERQLGRARAFLADDPGDGAIRGFAAALLAGAGRLDEAIDLVAGSGPAIDGDPESQLGLLAALPTIISVPGAAGDAAAQRRSREALLPVARRAAALGAAADPQGRLHVAGLEATLGILTGLGQTEEARACLDALESADPGSVVAARFRKELDALDPAALPPRR